MKTKHLPCVTFLSYWTALPYSLIFRLLASGRKTFPTESSSCTKLVYRFTVKIFYLRSSFNKWEQQAAPANGTRARIQ